ncbi:MAG: hypothetical protein IPM08_09560 [Actinomycetales bacterium]|nr:hypothetical protein [Actinomycetales bacterium]
MLSDAVTRLVDTGAQVVLTSGNHDSAIRLGFAARLLERAGLHIRTDVEGSTRAIPVGDGVIHAVPYLEPLAGYGSGRRTRGDARRCPARRAGSTST